MTKKEFNFWSIPSSKRNILRCCYFWKKKSITDLANHSEQSQSTVSGHVDDLVRNGILLYTHDKDRRKRVVEVNFEKLIDELIPEERSEYAFIEEERECIIRLLQNERFRIHVLIAEEYIDSVIGAIRIVLSVYGLVYLLSKKHGMPEDSTGKMRRSVLLDVAETSYDNLDDNIVGKVLEMNPDVNSQLQSLISDLFFWGYGKGKTES